MTKDDLINTHQAAALIGCSEESIRNYRRRNWLHPIRLATGRILFVRQEVERLREELIVKEPGYQVVEASTESSPWRKNSLRADWDPIIFDPAVWKAVAEYTKERLRR